MWSRLRPKSLTKMSAVIVDVCLHEVANEVGCQFPEIRCRNWGTNLNSSGHCPELRTRRRRKTEIIECSWWQGTCPARKQSDFVHRTCLAAQVRLIGQYWPPSRCRGSIVGSGSILLFSISFLPIFELSLRRGTNTMTFNLKRSGSAKRVSWRAAKWPDELRRQQCSLTTMQYTQRYGGKVS